MAERRSQPNIDTTQNGDTDTDNNHYSDTPQNAQTKQLLDEEKSKPVPVTGPRTRSRTTRGREWTKLEVYFGLSLTVFGIVLSCLFGIYSVVSYYAANAAVDEARTANQISLLQYCADSSNNYDGQCQGVVQDSAVKSLVAEVFPDVPLSLVSSGATTFGPTSFGPTSTSVPASALPPPTTTPNAITTTTTRKGTGGTGGAGGVSTPITASGAPPPSSGTLTPGATPTSSPAPSSTPAPPSNGMSSKEIAEIVVPLAIGIPGIVIALLAFLVARKSGILRTDSPAFDHP